MTNKGYDPKEISALQAELEQSGSSFKIVDSEDNGPEYVNFNFVGNYEGRDVIFDAVIYTLRLQHNSEIFEIAEKKASERFPEFSKFNYTEDENGDLAELDDLEEEIGLFMAEVMMELEEEAAVKVQEHIEIDTTVDYGIGLDVGLNVDEVNAEVISKFIEGFNADTIELDPGLYSFQHDED